MSKRILFACLGTVCAASVAFAGDAAKQMSEEEMMALWTSMATPGAPHKGLAESVGTWDAKVTMWMGAGAPSTESMGTSVNRMILGDRWLEQSFEGTMMGQPFHGLGYTGYDNYRKQYVGWWIDTSTTAAMMTTGNPDAGGKLVFTGTMDDCMTGGTVSTRQVLTVVDADHHAFEMWMKGADGQEFKSLEIQYSRRK